MIKVIHVLSDMKMGGAGRWLINFFSELDREVCDASVVLPKGSLLVGKLKELGVRVMEVNGIFDKSFDSKAVAYFYKLFKEEKPDIVHTHASLSARIGAKLAGVKATLNTKHCIDNPKKGVRKAFDAWLNMWLSKWFIAVSEAVRQNMIEAGITGNRIETVYCGVGRLTEKSEEEKRGLREKWHIGQEDIVVGIVARLAEIKGHIFFIQAAEKIIQGNENVKFLIAGTGPKEDALWAMVQKHELENKIIFTGYIDKVEDVYNIIDINVISSVSEALCFSLIEGMSLAKCCIGTATGGIIEVINDGQNGFLVPVKDPESLAEKMQLLIQDKTLRDKMGKVGLAMMKEKFSSEQMARKIEKTYTELVNAGGK